MLCCPCHVTRPSLCLSCDWNVVVFKKQNHKTNRVLKEFELHRRVVLQGFVLESEVWFGWEIHKEFLLDHPVRPSGDMPPPSSHQTNVVVLLLCAKTKSGSPSNERKKILKMRPSLLSLPPSLPPSEMASKQVSKFCFNFHIDMRCLRGCLHRRGSHVNNSACARVRLFVAWCMTIWQTWGR